MRNIIIFINGNKPKIVMKKGSGSRIIYLFPDGKPYSLKVQMAFATFKNGQSGLICYASDRPVSLNELLLAHEDLMGNC